MKENYRRVLGRSGIEVSALGLGCWAIGGPFILDGKPDGWGEIDDNESIKAIHKAMDLGINFLDTADCYGVGHSETVIGKAISGRRSSVVIATKFGYFGNEATKTLSGTNVTPDYIERACDASLKRLNTDYIDLYQIHVGNLLISEIEPICNTLNRLVAKGKIRTYGWSTDLLAAAKLIAERTNCSAIQHTLNVLNDSPQLIQFCEANNLASINRSPLAMGFLSGKFTADSLLTNDDVRGAGHSWVPYFKDGKPVPEFLQALDAVKEILTSNGRTLVQGALAWIWGKSNCTIPIPGFKTVKQVEENATAMEFGPLSSGQINEIEEILSRMKR
ncbi:MAG TPA: aldo/keto reductase [Bacillota bacterium]|nr:aldo/keto reductase [Bacillota bacterium]HOL10551.1 aldo/keto reductase [Bacillota bacterium]HPO98257.1 aldo/keto reductase [Bacillota bacterium]